MSYSTDLAVDPRWLERWWNTDSARAEVSSQKEVMSSPRSRSAVIRSLPTRVRSRVSRFRPSETINEEGSATAEYAIATMAAVGFAGLLVVIMKSDEVRGILTALVRNALSYG